MALYMLQELKEKMQEYFYTKEEINQILSEIIEEPINTQIIHITATTNPDEISGELTDMDDNPISGKTIIAHIYDEGENDETQIATTNNSGIFSFTTFDLSEIMDTSQNTGNLSNLYCDISYAGDGIYNGCSEHCQMAQMFL